MGSIPGCRTKILHAAQPKKKKYTQEKVVNIFYRKLDYSRVTICKKKKKKRVTICKAEFYTHNASKRFYLNNVFLHTKK